MPVLLTLHVFGAILLVGGMTTHVLLRPMAGRASDVAGKALLQFAWRVQLAMVYTGSALVLITGILLWIGRFKFFTGWLLLGVLLFVAAMGLDGAFLARTIRPTRVARGDTGAIAAAAHAESSATLAAAAMTVQLVAWFLLLVVVFLMVTQPF